MRYFRRRPPLLREASILGLLFPLAAIVLLLEALMKELPTIPQSSMDENRAVGIALNLGILSGACSFVVNNYGLRFRRPGRESYPLGSWKSQMRWLLLLSTLPLCALALAVSLPCTPPFDFALYPPTLLAVLVFGAAWVYAADRWQALT